MLQTASVTQRMYYTNKVTNSNLYVSTMLYKQTIQLLQIHDNNDNKNISIHPYTTSNNITFAFTPIIEQFCQISRIRQENMKLRPFFTKLKYHIAHNYVYFWVFLSIFWNSKTHNFTDI